MGVSSGAATDAVEATPEVVDDVLAERADAIEDEIEENVSEAEEADAELVMD